jgi:hypothetical protein
MRTGFRENHIQKIESGWVSRPSFQVVGIIVEELGGDLATFWKTIRDSVPDLTDIMERSNRPGLPQRAVSRRPKTRGREAAIRSAS